MELLCWDAQQPRATQRAWEEAGMWELGGWEPIFWRLRQFVSRTRYVRKESKKQKNPKQTSVL